MENTRLCVKGLTDANFAGTEHARSCTLVLAAGKAVASLVAAGVVADGGLNKYGIYVITANLLNVRRSIDRAKQNSVVNDIREALGLQFGRIYETDIAFGRLRYGKVMLVTGQVANGSKIKGLVVNLFHVFWPSLLKREGFMMQLIIPAVRVFRASTEPLEEIAVFNRPEDFRTSPYYDSEDVVVRQYSSLESFTPTEMLQYFTQIANRCVQFRYGGQEDDLTIERAFDVNSHQRNLWLQEFLEQEQTEQPPLYSDDIHEVTYKNFISREYCSYFIDSVEFTIPSAIDGLTRNERKVLHACLNDYPNQEINVLQLVGSVFEVSDYRCTADAIGDAIVRMGQDFIGRGNINLLMPLGQFGTRITGGKDAGNVQYLHTKLISITKYLFPEIDKNLLTNRKENGRFVEPQHYLPIIPLILVNGSSRFGRGGKTEIPHYHPLCIINRLLSMLHRQVPLLMEPFFRNFRGSVEFNDSHFETRGCITRESSNTVRITELPVGVWTHKYREVLNKMVSEGNIVSYIDNHTDKTVDFEVTLARPIPNDQDLYKMFKLVKKEKCIFNAYDADQNLRSFSDANAILRYFFEIRLQGYKDRIRHQLRSGNEEQLDRSALRNEEQLDELARCLWRIELEALRSQPEIIDPNVEI